MIKISNNNDSNYTSKNRKTEKFWSKKYNKIFSIVILPTILIAIDFLVGWLYRLMFPLIGLLLIIGIIYYSIAIIEDDISKILVYIINGIMIGAAIALFITTNLIVDALPKTVLLFEKSYTWWPLVNKIGLWVIGGVIILAGVVDTGIAIYNWYIWGPGYTPSSAGPSDSTSSTSYSTSSVPIIRKTTTIDKKTSSTSDIGTSTTMIKGTTPSDMEKTHTGMIPKGGGSPEEYRKDMENFRQEQGFDAPKRLEKKGPFEEMD